MPRESAADKAERLLISHAVTITAVDGRRVTAFVRGDSGAIHIVRHEAGHWSCTCESYRLCSHTRAVMHCTAPAGAVVMEQAPRGVIA